MLRVQCRPTDKFWAMRTNIFVNVMVCYYFSKRKNKFSIAYKKVMLQTRLLMSDNLAGSLPVPAGTDPELI